MESGDFGIALICGTEQVGECFFGGNWENQMDQSDPFESALSSMVSSPAASTGGGGGLMMRELIGRLGSICNSGDISPQFSVKHDGVNSASNTSCYNTPLSSPPKMNLSLMESQMRGNLGNHPGLPPFSVDLGFVERAARFSCFSGLNEQSGKVGTELPQRFVPNSVLNNHPNFNTCASDSKLSRTLTRENGDSKEESSVSEQIPGGNSTVEVQKDGNGKKRKSVPRGKSKESPSSSGTDSKVVAANDESSAKRSKQGEGKGEEKEKAEANGNGKTENNGNQKQNKENSKPAEPPKDYIHVRARRGQATDSHSLAERVRREKISERMKFLQDLVPGCNKVTGKAVMLDEIINYVQSLQRQVEFLSMKLATVNPRVDSKMEAFLPKDALQAQASSPHIVFPMTPQMQAFPFGRQLQQELPLHNSITATINTQFTMNQVNASLHQNLGPQLPSSLDRLVPGASQVPSVWEDDLQSIVQMGFLQNQLEGLHGQVKMEL